MIRVIVSVVPPGGNGTTSLIGLEGKACAEAASPHVAAQVESARTSTTPTRLSACCSLNDDGAGWNRIGADRRDSNNIPTSVQMRAHIALPCTAFTNIATVPSVLAFAVASIGRAGYKENT